MEGQIKVFFYNLTLSIGLLLSVYLRQNALSMVHLIFLISIPLSQMTNSQHLNITILCSPPTVHFVKRMLYWNSFILTLKMIYVITLFFMSQYDELFESSDVMLTLNTIGLVYDLFDVSFEAVLTVLLVFAMYNFPTYSNDKMSTNTESSNDNDDENNSSLLSIFKYLCLAIVCLNGFMFPSFTCIVYYVLSIVIITVMILTELSDKTFVYIFKITCMCTCIHVFILFTNQIKWIRSKVNLNLEKLLLDLITGHDSQFHSTEEFPKVQSENLFLITMLIIQHHVLWIYSCEIWSMCYPGWSSLVMLLWSTISWMYLDTRRNLMFFFLLGICTLLMEYIYILTGNDLLRQIFTSDLRQWSLNTRNNFPTDILIKTLFTLSFWLAIKVNIINPELNNIGLKKWSKKLANYLSLTWIVIIILMMLVHGFFEYNKINLIQIGFILLALLFLVYFQVSFVSWRKTMHLYWTVVVLYSMFVVTISYVFKFYGLADTLTASFHFSNDLLCDIGLDEIGYLKIIVPATISIIVLIYLQYFHQYFYKILDIDRKQIVSNDTENLYETNVDAKTKTLIKRILDTTIIFFHVHLNKLEIMLIAISVMNKPCLFNGMLLIMVLFWMLFDYNTYISNILFIYIASFICVTLGYQFSYFDHETWLLQFQLYTDKNTRNTINTQEEFGIYKLNFAELIGLKKLNTNTLIFNFLMYELLIIFVMILKRAISIYLTFKYYPQKQFTFIFPNVTYGNMNNGIPECLMYLVNNGFSLFGLEMTFITIIITMNISLDLCALINGLWLLKFTGVKSGKTISNYWKYFIAFLYFIVTSKYVLHIVTKFVPNTEIKWKTINIINDTSVVVLYDQSYCAWIRPLMSFDFILLVFASRQSIVYKNYNLNNSNDNEESFDYKYRTKSILDIFKRIAYENSLWIILVLIYLIVINNVDLFSIGYVCGITFFFWKGTHYFLLPLEKILQGWRWLLYYNILVILFKILFHLLGCLILNYFQWYPCIPMHFFTVFCPQQTSEKCSNTCGTFKHEIRLFLDVFSFTLILFQKRVFQSDHFLKVIDDTKIVDALASEIRSVVYRWKSIEYVENRQQDIEWLEKVKDKLKKIQQSKERLAKRQSIHTNACLDGEYMFENIYDDVFLVKKYDTNILSKYEDFVNGPWFYRQIISFVLYLTDKINEYSEKHRQITQLLQLENKLFMKNTEQFEMDSYYLDSSDSLTPMNDDIYFINRQYHENTVKHYVMQCILAVWNAGKSSTHLLCYFAIFYNAVQNLYDMISLIPVIMIILWGQLSVPRPSAFFWIVLITYTQITGLIRYIYSFKEVPWMQEEIFTQNSSLKEFQSYPTMKVGIGGYQNKFPTDLIVLLSLFIHRRRLIKLGFWTNKSDRKLRRLNKKNLTPLRLVFLNIKTHLSPIFDFYENLRKHQAKKSVNVYPAMFILIVIQIPYSLLNLSTATKLLADHRVSVILLKSFSIYIITIIIDRWLYVSRFIKGKLIFHIFFVIIFFGQLISEENTNFLNKLWAYIIFVYITVSAYQIRNGYLYRHTNSFIWSQYSIFNLILFKIYYYCPFIHEVRSILDWMWTDSSLTIMEWFKMDELFSHVCCIKSICNLRNSTDMKRGETVSRSFKLLVGGGIATIILTIIIFPVAWYSLFDSTPDIPSSVELTVKFGEESTIISTMSDEVQKLDSTDFGIIQDIYSNSLSVNKESIKDFLQQYKFDEISSINVLSRSINTWPITTYEFNRLKKLIATSSSIKVSAHWSITHHKGMKISRGKNTVMMSFSEYLKLNKCLNNLKYTSNNHTGFCRQIVIPKLLPKFLILNLKSTEVEVQSELMINDPSNPYTDVGLTFHYDGNDEFTYNWNVKEICPTGEVAYYLKHLPYSSCAVNDKLDRISNAVYNVYIFSDRYSSTLQFLDDKGMIGLYSIIVVYFGYKLAFDVFRSFKFKLSYIEIPYPDRILQLCYEIYLVRSFEEYEMEEDLYAMLIFLYRSPETLIRYTRLPESQ